MSVIEIYKLSLKAGLSDADATAAASAVIGTEDLKYLATKEDLARLEARIAALEARAVMTLWILGGIVTLQVLLIGLIVQVLARLP